MISSGYQTSAYLLPQSLKPLPLRRRIDPRPDHKGSDVEEWYLSLLQRKILRERQRQGRGDPGDFHDRHEPGSDGRADLVEGSRTGEDGHGGKVDRVLDRGNLRQ